MTKKLSLLLVTVLAVFGLITACNNDNGGDEGKKGTEYTVTFNKNNKDSGGTTEANPKTITVKAGETIGSFPTPPTRSQGWGAGTVFEDWYIDRDCMQWFDENTPITENITVYAGWEFIAGEPTVEGDTLVQIAPEITTGGAMQGTFDGVTNNDGSMTWQRGAIRYKYPTEGLDYDYVEIEYLGRDKDDKETGSLQYNILKDYNSSADYMPENGNQYPTLTLPSGKMKFLVRGAPSGGVAIQLNVPSGTTDEQLPTYKRTMKFTKATFTKGDRYTITYDPNYDGAEPIPDGFGVKGISIGNGKLPYLANRGDQEFAGWFLASDDTTEITATTTPTTDQITDNTLALKAKWRILVPATNFTVDFNASGIGLTGVGSGTTAVAFTDGSDTGYTFTYGSGGYRSSWVKFNITLDAGVNLSSYKEVTFQYQSVSGDTAYKPFALLGATTLPANFSVDPHESGTEYRINSGSNPQGNTTTGDNWGSLKFTIDKSKTANLNGTIQICIYEHSAATGGTPAVSTAWKIKNVTFVADD